MDSHGNAETVLAELTDQQRSVLALIAKRLTHKEIANELDISPARVSQHVRKLKDRLGSETLSGLADFFNRANGSLQTPSNESLSTENLVPAPTSAEHEGLGIELIQEPEQANPDPAVGASKGSERLVPEALDGQYGTALRIGYILAVAFGTVAIVLVLFAAMDALSNILSEAFPS